MSEQKFVKNTNVPPEDSELWSVAEGWKISGADKLPYTKLEQVYHTPNDHKFLDALNQQLDGEVKQSLDVGLSDVFVAYLSQDGTELVKAWPRNRSSEADKKASYNKGRPPKTGQGTATQSPQQKITEAPKQQIPTEIPPTKGIIPSSKSNQVIEVPYDIEPIPWNDAPSIERAESEGKFILPVKFTGVENWGFISTEDGTRTFYYGKIKLVRIQEQ